MPKGNPAGYLPRNKKKKPMAKKKRPTKKGKKGY